MNTHVELRSGAYADSVTLLQVSRTIQDLPGVTGAQVAMATPLNVEVLQSMGFELPDAATPNDLVVALRLDDGASLEAALAAVDAALLASTRRDVTDAGADLAPHRTTATALRDAPDALVLVSVPGASAFIEAMDALDAGHDVMVFSDNVPVDQEVLLKRTATQRGLLVMGPDCGTAVVGGVGLGFANAVSPGPVGLVAASGTGCQQLLALLDHAAVGVTSALGVGGRDLSGAVGGLSTFEALRRLDADPDVELAVVVSKPPAPEVAAALELYAATLATPVELALLGPGQPDLTAATERVLQRLGHEIPSWPVTTSTRHLPDADPAETSRRVRLCGLFVGGTLATEARLIVEEELGEGHTFIDFGDDAYTTGRAHPMIDPSLRLEHLAQVAADPDTAVVLLDVVLGHGAEPDPAARLAPAITAITAIGVPVVVAVVGTVHDPQDLHRQVRVLAEAGAEVHLSNAGATRRAIEILGGTR